MVKVKFNYNHLYEGGESFTGRSITQDQVVGYFGSNPNDADCQIKEKDNYKLADDDKKWFEYEFDLNNK